MTQQKKLRSPGPRRVLAAALLLSLFFFSFYPFRSQAWGAHGHRISGKAAVLALPREMPRFFRKAANQLSYLNPEPDRWRDRKEREIDPAMQNAFDPDHFINFERFAEGTFEAEDRFGFLIDLKRSGMERPEAGISFYRILEMFQRLRVQFRLWRGTRDKRTREWIQQRIINDAGILGHYVSDGANPLHTSIHHHGWIGENPHGYATDRETHSRFESRYVEAQITLEELRAQVSFTPRVFPNVREAVMEYLQISHGYVEELYQIDKRSSFNSETIGEENEHFTLERLSFGVEMLRDLWWTAWMTSAEDWSPPTGPGH